MRVFRWISITFMMASLIILPHFAIAQSVNPAVQIMPRTISSQPFDLSITVQIQAEKGLSMLKSFEFILNGQDITQAFLSLISSSPQMVSISPDFSKATVTLPSLSLPAGTYQIQVSMSTTTGEVARDTVTYEVTGAPPIPPQPSIISFANQVLPIFKLNCVSCHGGIAGLSLDSYSGVIVGGVSGRAVIPGNSANSLLVKRISGDLEGPRMPLGVPPLSDKDIQTIKDWIDQGAINN